MERRDVATDSRRSLPISQTSAMAEIQPGRQLGQSVPSELYRIYSAAQSIPFAAPLDCRVSRQ